MKNLAVEAGGRTFLTNDRGQVLVTGLGAGPTARVNVNLDRLENPSVKTPPLIVQLSPRPGEVTRVEYPVQPTGEIMIRLLLRRADGSVVGLSSVLARLVGKNGYVAEAKSEFDGSASFQELPAGNYTLELDPEQAKRLRMRLVEPLRVSIKADGGFNTDAKAEVAFEARPGDQESQPG